VSLLDRMKQRRIAVVGFGIVAVSLFGTTAPAFAAAAPTRTVASTTTPTIGVGSPAKLKATVRPVTGSAKPTGTVTFREGTSSLGTVALALVGTTQTAKLNITTLVAGTHSIVATYNGSTDYATSTSLPVTVVVGKADTKTTASSSTPMPLIGKDAKMKAGVKQVAGGVKPTGSVTFSEGTTTIATVPLALAGTTMTAAYTVTGGLPLGAHVITATYNGSGTFATSSSTVTITVVKGTTDSVVTTVPSDTTPGKTTIVIVVKAVLPATGIPTGTATFVVDSLAPQILPLNDTGRAQLPITFAVGSTHSVTVTYNGDPKFLTSVGTASFTS
jgi:large repetitive protein